MVNQEQIPVRGVSSNECPVSLISPQSIVVIGIHGRASLLKDANVLGDGSLLPSKLIDGLEQVAIEKARADDTITAALRRNRHHQDYDLEE